MAENRVRWASGITAALVAIGLIIQICVVTAGTNNNFSDYAISRVFNLIFYFTIDSNILVGVTSLLLALNIHRDEWWFQFFRFAGLLGITITGIIYHWLLAGLVELTPWGEVANLILHTLVPAAAVIVWLLVKPVGLTSLRIAAYVLLYPICWLVVTLIRGPIVEWYPYPFVDVIEHGYERVALNCVGVAVLFAGFSFGMAALDRWLTQRTK